MISKLKNLLIKYKDKIMYIAFIISILALVLGGCQYLNYKIGLADDHPLEEMIEKKIEDEIGLDIDLTPDSKE